MMHLILEVGDNMTKYISREIKKAHCCLEAKEICAKFSTDAVASCAFGLAAQSFDDENAAFRKMGKMLFAFNFTNGIRQTSYFFTPIIAHLFRLPFLEPVVTAFMTDVLARTIADRESTGYKRNDLVDVIIQMKNKFGKTTKSVGRKWGFCLSQWHC